jgi:hypothetical protein
MSIELRAKLDSMDLVRGALLSALEGLGSYTSKNERDFLWCLSGIAKNARYNQAKFIQFCFSPDPFSVSISTIFTC